MRLHSTDLAKSRMLFLTSSLKFSLRLMVSVLLKYVLSGMFIWLLRNVFRFALLPTHFINDSFIHS